ncbi:MAG: EscU/YscU/HrcU family type III secretion system export apparatus switch protein [Candidatus Omnitrophica bacterium]|nr:EscU/YscU/HrcU family type III secretion system export apparatus switch protein [Candidatus Omnitrophota bacterium]
MVKKAVALKYHKDKDLAPRLTAKGRDLLAERIIELAHQFDVPIYEDDKLVNQLYNLDLGEYIPRDFYVVVATVLAWVYSLDKPLKKKI